MSKMSRYQRYERKSVPAEMRPYVPGEDLSGISVGEDDRANGSPKEGDMIARDPTNHADKWLVNAKYFADNFITTPITADDAVDQLASLADIAAALLRQS